MSGSATVRIVYEDDHGNHDWSGCYPSYEMVLEWRIRITDEIAKCFFYSKYATYYMCY